MNDKRINYVFDFYEPSNELVDSIDGPGGFGIWFTGPSSPAAIAIIPITEDKAKKHLLGKEWYQVEQIPLNEKMEEKRDQTRKTIAIADIDENDAKAIAQEFGCQLFYTIEWDVERVFVAHDLATGEQVGWRQE